MHRSGYLPGCDCAQVAEWLMAADCKSAAPWSYGGSNPPLCTMDTGLGGVKRGRGMNEEPESLEPGPPEERGPARKWIALALLGVVAGLVWKTMDPDKIRFVVLLLLAAIAVRILLAGFSGR